MTKLKRRISDFFSNLFGTLSLKYKASKFAVVVEKIVRFLGFVFWPLGWIKERTFDKLRFDVQKRVVSFIFLLPVIIGFLIFFAYPLISSFVYSFSTLELTDKGIILHFSKFFTQADIKSRLYDNPVSTQILYNYKYAFTVDADFPSTLLATLGTTFSDCAVITIFSLLLAVMLNSKFKGRGLVRAIFFLPVIFYNDIVLSVMKELAAANGGGGGALTELFDMGIFLQGIGIPRFFVSFLTGITKSIFDTITFSGIQIIIFLTAIQSVPKHLYEAAKMEGATQYEMFWKITLPMVSPMIPTVVVYTVIDGYTRSELNTLIDKYAEDSQYGVHAAMSWLYLIVIAIFLLVVLGILSKVVFYYDDKK